MSELTPTSPSIAAPDILLVDDSQDDIDLLMLAFELNKSAATVEVARDGVAALDFLLGGESRPVDVRGALPRVVLLDLNMPRLNGFEVLERLRAHERTRLLPVVIFSSSDQRSDEQEAHRLGANGYIRKPAGFKNLCTVLAQLERDWVNADAAPQPSSG